jgi:hypothetical protein
LALVSVAKIATLRADNSAIAALRLLLLVLIAFIPVVGLVLSKTRPDDVRTVPPDIFASGGRANYSVGSLPKGDGLIFGLINGDHL